MNDLYLIRHGQASFGKENYDNLSALGIRQSQVLAQHLVRTGKAPQEIYSGCLERHFETLHEYEACYSRETGTGILPLIKLDFFNEYDSEIIWQALLPAALDKYPDLAVLRQKGVDKKAFQRIFAKVMELWVSGSFEPLGVPRWSDFKQRVRQGLAMIMSKYEAGNRAAVFTSSGPISAAVQVALGLSDEKTLKLSWQIFNASVTRFKYNQHEITLTGFNDITHLEIEGSENLLTYQ